MSMTQTLVGRRLGSKTDTAVIRGEVLRSLEPISFLGEVDPLDGKVKNQASSIYGKSVKGKVLVFPGGRGSTVGSFVIYGLSDQGNAPLAMVVGHAEAIVAVGAMMAGIPLIDSIDISYLHDGDVVTIKGNMVEVEARKEGGN